MAKAKKPAPKMPIGADKNDFHGAMMPMKGVHKMPNGMPMKDAEMKPMMGKMAAPYKKKK